MTRKRLQTCGLLAAALPLLLMQGCPNSEFIENQVGGLEVRASARPNDTGRYEIAQLGLSQLELRPTDPQAASSLEGADPIGALKGSPALELNVADQPLSGLPLTTGSYQVETLKTFGFTLVDQNPPANPQTCLEEHFPFLQENFVLEMADPDSSFTIRVPTQGQATMRIVVNSPGLIALFESSYFCSESPSACGIVPAPCAIFTPPAAEDVAAFISLE